MKMIEHKNNYITFDEKEHKYMLNGKTPLESVTTLVHAQFPPFETEVVAEKYAKKNGQTAQYWIENWEAKKNAAAKFGTEVHEYIEHYLFRDESMPFTRPPINGLDKFLDKLKKEYEIIFLEKLVFSPQWKIAGTVDAVLKHKETGKICIFDWKTSKKITKYNKYQRGLGALSHMSDCNYSHYSLQLNLYKAILHNEDYLDCTDCKMAIIHINEKGIKEITVEDKEVELGYILMQKEVL